MLTPRMRTAAGSLALATTLLMSGCGTEEGDSETPAPTTAPTAVTENEVVTVLEAFWAERVRVESSGRYDTADFSGILSRRMIEPQSQQYRQFDEMGFRRVGQPQLRDFTAEVDGDTAIATVCVQEDEWGAEADVQIAEPEPQGWYASSHRLERADDAWLIVDTAKPPAGVSC
ncbi:hypothetical protein H9L21_08540 [Aeromicrobium senzhongii]|uniref:Nuclear transport factor 2 family protein n=1 Tax=Aeromicrobium senzhongii TaxID=2663859 RepID=A0ABX6SP90_9ACTN|nr:hypothetical protein [Aeromicrobium senzhongii]MTB86986.1 hypothetical protein [Aeromicrobium senzhongii]QNL93188.1 hypothetical protein H9L21_08540 [Aeromicrobium senzhongii]